MRYLYNHTSPETAYEVENYPWGFRLRTKIRYWIETSDKPNGGERFCSQTINPKTGIWCAPKKSTYSMIMVLFLDKNEHVKFEAINRYTSKETLEEFKQVHLPNLSEFQKEQLRILIATEKVMKNVTCTVEVVPFGYDYDERKKEQEEVFKKINRMINYEYAKTSL